jgi:hypothetical protein
MSLTSRLKAVRILHLKENILLFRRSEVERLREGFLGHISNFGSFQDISRTMAPEPVEQKN